MVILSLIVFLYILVTMAEAAWRWQKKSFSLSLAIFTWALCLLLIANTWAYAYAYEKWQISVFAVGFLILGILPQIQDLREGRKLSIITHFIRLTIHISFILLLILAAQA